MSHYNVKLSTHLSKDELLIFLAKHFHGIEVTQVGATYPINLIYDGHLIDSIDVNAQTADEALKLALTVFKMIAPYDIQDIDSNSPLLESHQIELQALSIDR